MEIAIHIHGAKSRAIQDHFAELLRQELGFGEEVVLTPQTGLVTQARPDFFFEIAHGRGIIAEVERGGTITNNHSSGTRDARSTCSVFTCSRTEWVVREG
jgi:hypothetical protein